jgi:glutathione S-transferase
MEFVDLETAKTGGVRIVASGLVASPWSEAAKAIFTIASIPFVVVRGRPRDATFAAWTGANNVPVVFHDDDPPRAVWSQIVALAARIGRPGSVLPDAPDARVKTVGLLHEIAGEDGLGWNARMLMIDASMTSQGARGFVLPVAQYLAPKYGYAPERIDAARTRAISTLRMLAEELGDAQYFGGDRPNALDAYSATFLTPLTAITDADCPAMAPPLRAAFGVAAEQLGPHTPPSLLAHRHQMFERHLPWPIAI